MTNHIQQNNQEKQAGEPAVLSFGARLTSARKILGLETKDAAAQLRLSEKIILLMEKDQHPELPATFVRGYLRAYGKLLQIPEQEVNQAIEPMMPISALEMSPAIAAKTSASITSGSYFMQLFTYLIILTLMGLVGMWWYTHTASLPSPALADEGGLKPPLFTANNANPPPQSLTIQPPSLLPAPTTPPPLSNQKQAEDDVQADSDRADTNANNDDND